MYFPVKKKSLFAFIITLTVIILFSFIYLKPDNTQSILLPHDVDMVINDYQFTHNKDGLTIFIKGKTAITKGQKVLGLRSMTVKNSSIEEINGKISNETRFISFAAVKGSCGINLHSPLKLENVRSLVVGGKDFSNVKSAEIDLNSLRVVAVFNDGVQKDL